MTHFPFGLRRNVEQYFSKVFCTGKQEPGNFKLDYCFLCVIIYGEGEA